MPATVTINGGLSRRVIRVSAVVAVLVCLVLGAALASTPTAAAQPTPTPTPTPTPALSPAAAPSTVDPAPSTPVTCFPGSLQFECQTSITTPPAAPTGVPPCAGPGCIPQPTTLSPAPSGPGTGQPAASDGGDQPCGLNNIGGCVANGVNDFFRGAVKDALNPLLTLLSNTLLTTPTPDSLPRIGELWDGSWQILLVSYAMLILLGGIVVMSYETLQTRHGIKEILPRVIVGFLSAALSLWMATQATSLANALSQSVMGGGLDANTAGDTLRNLILGPLNALSGGIFITFMGLTLAGMLLVLLVTYIVRVALTLILITAAPIALMAHALPQTEGLAYWWWKAFGGCLAIQVAQSLTLIVAVKVFLAPGGFTVFGPTLSGLVNILVALALCYILIKIPFWILGSLRGSGRRSFVGSLIRGYLAYKTFGLLRGRGGGKPPMRGGGQDTEPEPDPYAKARTTPSGQYMLPLDVKRVPRPPSQRHRTAPPPRSRSANRGTQLALPLDGEWPENKPRLGRDGQYQLPLQVQRQPKPKPPPAPAQKSAPRPRGRQLKFPADGQWSENRPRLGRDAQYRLPLDVQRARKPEPPPAPPPPTRPARGRQLALPLDLPKVRPPTTG